MTLQPRAVRFGDGPGDDNDDDDDDDDRACPVYPALSMRRRSRAPALPPRLAAGLIGGFLYGVGIFTVA